MKRMAAVGGLGLAGVLACSAPATSTVEAPPRAVDVAPLADEAPSPAPGTEAPKADPDKLPWVARRQSRFGKLCRAFDVSECEKLCEQGSALSCARYGTILLMAGILDALPAADYTSDPAGGRKAWERACDAGYPAACVDLAWLLRRGIGGDEDAARAVALNTAACDAGIAKGCFGLAKSMDDDAKAQPYFEKACRLGSQDGCFRRALTLDTKRPPPGMVSVPPYAQGALTCPAGTRLQRSSNDLLLDLPVSTPALFCARDEDGRRVEHGPYIQFASREDERVRGVVRLRGRYVDGKREGRWEKYDLQGRLIRRTIYRAGEEHEVTPFDPDSGAPKGPTEPEREDRPPVRSKAR